MTPGKTLFDEDHPDRGNPEDPEKIFNQSIKETIILERLKNLEEKIAAVVERVKALKERKKRSGEKNTRTGRSFERKKRDHRIFKS